MPKLEREEFMTTLRGYVGESPDDNGMKFLADAAETFDEMKKDADTYKDKYEKADADWRKKYADAFNAPAKKTETEEKDEEDKKERAETIRISDLFIKKEGK